MDKTEFLKTYNVLLKAGKTAEAKRLKEDFETLERLRNLKSNATNSKKNTRRDSEKVAHQEDEEGKRVTPVIPRRITLRTA